MAFFVVVLALLLLAVALAVGLAARSQRRVEEANALVAGQPTPVPSSWAGSHDAEAVLHRRLRDALAALRDNPALGDDLTLVELRGTLEHEALGLDQQLVAIARLPANRRTEPLAHVGAAVDLIEQTVASAVGSSNTDAAARLRTALQGVQEHQQALGQAWDELDPPVMPVSSPIPLAGERPAPPPADRPEPPPPPDRPVP